VQWDVDAGLPETTTIYEKMRNTSIGCHHTCPTCGRKCDADKDVVNHVHECTLGHQVRAFSGARMEDGKANTCTCDEMDDNQPMEVVDNWAANAKKKETNWAKHKDVLRKKPKDQEGGAEGGMNWEFLHANGRDAALSQHEDNMHNAWNRIGPCVCEDYNAKGNPIEFCTYTGSRAMALHIILVLDESGSMSGTKFENQRKSAKGFIESLFRTAHSSTRVSVALFASVARTLGLHKLVDAKDMVQNMGQESGGTDFGEALAKAKEIAEEDLPEVLQNPI
jgi:hypothetical protein